MKIVNEPKVRVLVLTYLFGYLLVKMFLKPVWEVLKTSLNIRGEGGRFRPGQIITTKFHLFLGFGNYYKLHKNQNTTRLLVFFKSYFSDARTREALALPIFGRSVNPIPTMMVDSAQTLLVAPPMFFTLRHHVKYVLTLFDDI